MGTITRLLTQADEGDPKAHDELFTLVYKDLRRLAQSLLHQWPSIPLDGTELVSMACLKLLANEQLSARDRKHFFFVLGRAMNDVLADERRRNRALKRGGGWQRMPLGDPVSNSRQERTAMLDLGPALAELARVDPDAAAVTSLRMGSGYSLREAARILGVSLARVRADWTYAQAWLAARTDGRHPPE